MNILDTIVAHKKREVEERKSAISVDELQSSKFFQRPTFSLKKFLLDENRTGIIAEFKRRSPSKGTINANADAAEVTEAYAKNGASGLSVLTDEHFFGGRTDDLMKARVNEIPILRKDFMIDEYQFYEAKSIGADVVLLIAACLTPVQVKQFASLAKQLSLEVLLEIHNEDELEHIGEDVDIVGVNNRNLKTFQVDINTSLNLFDKIPSYKPAVAESGIGNVDTIITLKNAGFKGFLIGENFMKESDPAIAFQKFTTKLKAATE